MPVLPQKRKHTESLETDKAFKEPQNKRPREDISDKQFMMADKPSHIEMMPESTR